MIKTIFLPLIFTLIPFVTQARGPNPQCAGLFSGKTDLEITLENNLFATSRGIRGYQDSLAANNIPTFLQFLNSLRDGAVWLDSGAGEAYAMREALTSEAVTKNLKMVAVAYKKPSKGDLQKDLDNNASRLQYVDGGYIENLVHKSPVLKKLKGKVDFISEVFGPLVYTSDMASVLNAYADLLSLNGKALIHFNESHTTMSVNKNGSSQRLLMRDFSEFISIATGGRLVVKAKELPTKPYGRAVNYTIFWIEKVSNESKDAYNPLHLERMIDGAPPFRKYQIDPKAVKKD